MKTPSYVGEAAAVIAVLSFIYWAAALTPAWLRWLWIPFGALFILDWMLGGVADDGICKRCFTARVRKNATE